MIGRWLLAYDIVDLLPGLLMFIGHFFHDKVVIDRNNSFFHGSLP